jgi:glycosyltransferase involved in cell wall biosynthesis
MPKEVRISAVIPAFNRERTVARAIDSALAQESPPSEILVVDDGSIDATAQVVGRYGGKCRLICQDNAGVSSARNRGIEASQSEWIAFLDSDDYWERDHLSKLADAVRATGGEAALYFRDAALPRAEGGISYWDRCGFSFDGPYLLRRDASPWVMLPVQPMLLQASLIGRSSYQEVGGLPTGLRTREDTLLFFKLGIRFPACAVAGRGTVMTSDGALRLTQEIASTDPSYWRASLLVYREMLSFAGRFRPEFRRYFRASLSAAYFSRARLAYRKREPVGMIGNLMASAGRSPAMFVKQLRGSLARHHAGE